MSEQSGLPEKVEVLFPRGIDLEEARGLMDFIGDKLPATIGYVHTTKFEGAIRRNSDLATAFFKLESVCSNGQPRKYSSLRFHTLPKHVPGDDPKEVEIWENARVLVENYFSQLPK